MESGQWIDGRYEPFEPRAQSWASDADLQGTDPEHAPLAISWAGGEARQGELALADAGGTGAIAVDVWAGGSEDAPPPTSDAGMRVVAGVLTPLAVLLVAAGVTVLVRQGPSAVAGAEGPVAAAMPTRETLAPLPPLPDFSPDVLTQAPVPPVAGGPSAADVPDRSAVAARTSVAAARRIAAATQPAAPPAGQSAAPPATVNPPASGEPAPGSPPPSSEAPAPEVPAPDPTPEAPAPDPDPGPPGQGPGPGPGPGPDDPSPDDPVVQPEDPLVP